jgi:hypothetical protein
MVASLMKKGRGLDPAPLLLLSIPVFSHVQAVFFEVGQHICHPPDTPRVMVAPELEALRIPAIVLSSVCFGPAKRPAHQSKFFPVYN